MPDGGGLKGFSQVVDWSDHRADRSAVDSKGQDVASVKGCLVPTHWPFPKSFAASRTRFVDHRSPDAFGFENEFNGFADRAAAGEGFRGVVRGFLYLGDGIAHGNGEAGTTHQGNIRKIITDIGDGRV